MAPISIPQRPLGSHGMMCSAQVNAGLHDRNSHSMQQSRSSCGLTWPCLSVLLCSPGAAPNSLLQAFWRQPAALQVPTTDTAQALTASLWLQGYGGMGLSSSYSTNMVPEDQALAVIHRAKELGITLMVGVLSCLGLLVCGLEIAVKASRNSSLSVLEGDNVSWAYLISDSRGTLVCDTLEWFLCAQIDLFAISVQDSSDIYGSPGGHENEYLFGELRAPSHPSMTS